MSETFTRELSAVIDLIDKYQRFKVSGAELVNELKAALTPAAGREHPKLGVHLQHCNFGEYPNECKYGEDDCPALTESWSWFGKALQRAEASRAAAPEPRQDGYYKSVDGMLTLLSPANEAIRVAAAPAEPPPSFHDPDDPGPAPARPSLRERIEKLRKNPLLQVLSKERQQGYDAACEDVLAAIGGELFASK